MSDGDDPRERRHGPFSASKETTEDGRPVGIEVAGGRATGGVGRGDAPGTGPGGTTGGADGGDHHPPRGAGSAAHPHAVEDEKGVLDDAGETRREEPRDIHDREDLRASADRDLDTW